MNAQNRRQRGASRRHEDVARTQRASLIHALPLAIASETLDGRIQTWNAGAERIYGYTADEIVGEAASVLVPPERYEEDRGVRENVAQGRAIARLETVRRRKDGAAVEVSLDIAPVLGPAGEILSICTVTQSRERAEPWPREKAQLLLALAASGAGAFRFDVASDACQYDDAFARLWQLPNDETVNARGVLARVHSEDRAQLLAALEHSTREGTEFALEHRVVLPADGERWLFSKGKAFTDATGRLRYMTGVSVDVTHRRRAEEALRQSEERFRGMAEAIPSIVWESDPQGRSLYKNRMWFDYTGRVLERGTEEDWLQFYHPDDRGRVRREWQESARTEAALPLDTQARIRRRDGVYRWFRVRAAPIRDSSGAIVRWAGTCTDIDDQKRAAQALEDADRHKNEFLAMLAHELRNPLASIRNAAEIVKMSVGENARLRYATDVIGRQTERLGRLIADLLDLSNISRGKLALRREPCDLATVVRDALEMNRAAIEGKHHDLEVRLPDRPLVIMGDASRLVQLVSNLIDNAVKYSPGGGAIAVTLGREGERAVLRVRDAGAGIDPVLLPRVFDLFVQGERPSGRTEGGLGIGLALVKEIAAMHRGSVTARSRGPGQGAEFSVSLPLSQNEAAGARPEPDRAAAAGPTPARRVLIVDDNRDYADSLAMLLQHLGHHTLTLNSSAEALAQAPAFAPDVALLDIGLPGIDGAELCRRLHQEPRLAHTVHVAISGFGREADRAQTRAAGFAHHLLKPVRLSDLLPIIANADARRADAP